MAGQVKKGDIQLQSSVKNLKIKVSVDGKDDLIVFTDGLTFVNEKQKEAVFHEDNAVRFADFNIRVVVSKKKSAMPKDVPQGDPSNSVASDPNNSKEPDETIAPKNNGKKNNGKKNQSEA